MREIGPIEKALAAVERLERELRTVKAELAASLPDDGSHHQDWITHPVTGKRITIRRSK
jgi:hypothetical protein